MKQSNLESMSADELWILHEKIRSILSTKLEAEKHELVRRLVNLRGALNTKKRRADPTRRCIQNIGIRSGPLKLGLDGASNRVGWVHS